MYQDAILTSSGVLRYSLESGQHRLVVEVDRELARYYRSLIPKWIDTNKPKYSAHISVVRKEVPIELDHWGKYEGQPAMFHYSPIVHCDEVYLWLNCFSTQLEEIRVELGLPIHSEYTRPPNWFWCFHLTIGNFKKS
jgi:hypothetical protein